MKYVFSKLRLPERPKNLLTAKLGSESNDLNLMFAVFLTERTKAGPSSPLTARRNALSAKLAARLTCALAVPHPLCRPSPPGWDLFRSRGFRLYRCFIEYRGRCRPTHTVKTDRPNGQNCNSGLLLFDAGLYSGLRSGLMSRSDFGKV